MAVVLAAAGIDAVPPGHLQEFCAPITPIIKDHAANATIRQ